MNDTDLLENALDDLKADPAEFINRRINHQNFAKTIFWLCAKFTKGDFVYASELADFLQLSQARANQILNDFCRASFLQKRFPTSNLVEYWGRKEKDKVAIMEYFEKARKVLKIKAKLMVGEE